MFKAEADTLLLVADHLIKILEMLRWGDGKLTVKKIKSIVIFFQSLSCMAVPVQRVDQMVAQFLVKGLNTDRSLAECGDPGKILSG